MVHIKKVEIFGFKSFGFKNTTVQFEPGLVSISGPNGSGKSNILDAITFALGENRPKVMRVDKLRSLLHDIEGNRRGPKLARASVHFDNSDRKIPVDSDSVEITREMDANGENNYYLNKKKTNRSHVLDLLDVANAGLNQLNNVQQGTVTRISEFSSEEKRQAIEDLIGLSYFDEKKTEAVKQLDEADRRLEIALAKMGEIKKRIDELEEERNQKLRHSLLEKELNRYNAISASNKLKIVRSEKLEKEQDLSNINNELSKLEGQRSEIRKEIEELESKKSEFMTEVNAYQEAKAKIDSEISNAMHNFEVSNSTIVAAEKRIQQIENRLPQIENEINEIETNRQQINSKIKEAQMSIQETQNKKFKINEELKLIDTEREKVLKEQAVIAEKKLEIDNKIKKLSSQLNDAELKLSKMENEREESDQKIKLNKNKFNDFTSAIEELQKSKARLELLKKNHEETIKELNSRISKLNSKKLKIEKDLEDLNLILEKSSKAAAQYESKIKTVKSVMHEDYTIAKLKEDSDKLGIKGLVYELISWDKEFERPVLAVSSDWIKSFVVDDFTTLLNVAEFARSKNLPKLKIIPLDAIPNYKLNIPDKQGVIGPLSDYVKCAKEFSALKTFLFGNVILTESRESAHKLSKSGYKSVTIQGEFFEAKGGGVVIDINSKISKLTKVISMSTDIEGLQQSIKLLKRFQIKTKNNLKKVEDSISNHKDRLSISKEGLATTDQSYSDLKWKIDSAKQMQQQLSQRISDLEQKNRNLLIEISKQESYVDSLKDRISIVEENYAGGEQMRISNELSRINQKKSDKEKELTTIMSEYNEKSSVVATLTADDTKERSHAKNLHEEKESLIVQKEENKNKIDSLQDEIHEKENVLVKLREKEQELIATSGSSMSQIKEYDDKLKVLHENDRTLTKEINAMERRSDSLNRDLNDLNEDENSLQQILNSCGFNENIETFDVEPIVQGLRAELNALTALNAKAPETYVEISDGYRSMSTRKNSLEEERNSIVKFIEEIEKDKRQTFLDAFDKVDKEIKTIFSKMSGGNAWLELENEDDIFNSGISYLIQFPNKPKRTSTSISGGEKTLAAIVFVLALQKLKPSPFYLFDEVDAHLDAPNSERLSNILEERARESQFIMVSLKDSVVQKAKLIYGVYPKHGVSEVVTYKDKRLPSVKTS